MARVAGKTSRVIRGRDLRESFRLGAVGFVTARAHQGRVQLRWRDRRGIIRVLRQSTVASLARDNDMSALLLLLDDFGMADLARFVAGVGYGPARGLSDRRPAIVTVLPKAPWHDRSTQDNECDQRDRHHRGQPDQVLCILKQGRFPRALPSGTICARICAILFDTGYLPRGR